MADSAHAYAERQAPKESAYSLDEIKQAIENSFARITGLVREDKIRNAGSLSTFASKALALAIITKELTGAREPGDVMNAPDDHLDKGRKFEEENISVPALRYKKK